MKGELKRSEGSMKGSAVDEGLLSVFRKNNILCVRGFLTKAECRQLIQLFATAPKVRTGRWKQRTGWPRLPSSLRSKLHTGVRNEAEVFFSRKFKQINLNVTMWKPGDAMSAHFDYGVRGEYPEREFAAICYLNDDFSGGETYFPSLRIEVKPEVGTLIVFQGGKLKHGVRLVKDTERYTAGSWLGNEAP